MPDIDTASTLIPTRARASMVQYGGQGGMSTEQQQTRREQKAGEPAGFDGEDPSIAAARHEAGLDDQGGEQAGAAQGGEDPPEKPSPNPNAKRDEIIARFNSNRDGEALVPLEQPDEYSPPFARQNAPKLDEGDDAGDNGREPTREERGTAEPARPPTEAPAAPETFELTVRGNRMRMTRDQMVAAAQLDPEEAKELPVSVILRSAQILEAAKMRLTEAKDARPPAPTRAETPHRGSTVDDEDEDQDDRERRDQPVNPYRDAAEKVQFGDPEEAAEAIRRAALAAADERSQMDRSQRINEATQQAVSAFAADNPDLDEDLHTLVFNQATKEIKADLVRLGYDRDAVEKVITSPQDAAAAYRELQMRGQRVRSQREILDAAALTVRQRFLPDTVQQRTQTNDPQRAGVDANQRLAAKRSLPSQPTRAAPSGQATTSASPPEQSGRSAAVQEMRKARGFGR